MADQAIGAGAINMVRAAEWTGYGWLRHGFSLRAGGLSSVYSAGGPGELNLGWTKDDDPANVAENRRLFLADTAASPSAALVTLRQVHSAVVRVVEAGDGVFQTTDGKAALEGDGLMTDVPGVMLGIQTADCVPVLVVDVKRRAVAAFHAGWRGTAARIVERGIATMRERYGSRPEDLAAAIGPSIGACCYAVGEELRAEFASQFGYAAELFSEITASGGVAPQMHLDLWEANRRQLLDAGMAAERITVIGECSACTRVGERRKYFSHRAENGFTGRMMAVVGVAG